MKKGVLILDADTRSFEGELPKDFELHATAYATREKIKSASLKKLHERMLIACDENGVAKNLPVNILASILVGFRVLGDAYVFLDESKTTLTIKHIEDMLEEIE